MSKNDKAKVRTQGLVVMGALLFLVAIALTGVVQVKRATSLVAGRMEQGVSLMNSLTLDSSSLDRVPGTAQQKLREEHTDLPMASELDLSDFTVHIFQDCKILRYRHWERPPLQHEITEMFGTDQHAGWADSQFSYQNTLTCSQGQIDWHLANSLK